jgi:hypothetical protein
VLDRWPSASGANAAVFSIEYVNGVAECEIRLAYTANPDRN